MLEVWQFLLKGGITMIPLGLCSILGLAVVIEKGFSLRRKKVIVPEIVNVLENIRGPMDVGLALSICEKHEGPFANIIRVGLESRNLPKDEIKEALGDQGRQEVRTLERGLVMLETIAGIGPLLGLFGTVLGIFKVFNVISTLGVGQAQAFSSGLSEAIITTIVGLAIGIPAVVFYNYFTNKAENFILEIEKYSSALVKKVASFKSNYDEVNTDAI
ncbi:MAG TPA: MotA/TolQ/ExbB proton channel family protein [bacterium]